MIRSSFLFLAVICASASAENVSNQGSGGLGGGSQIEPIHGPDVSPEELAAANASADAFLQANPDVLLRSSSSGTPEKFAFYPMAGRLYKDLYWVNFVDLDPTGGILDFECTELSYNGHDATDTDLRSFGEQAIGVPIFAALDGTVISVQDGRTDMNTCPAAPCFPSLANFVILQHAAGRRTYYWHFKKDSILVSLGQDVKAGEQLGLTGSSGNSSGPHLHFATYDDDGATLVEPFSGDCQTDESQWVDQPVVDRDLYLRDLGFAFPGEDMGGFPGPPYIFPRTGQIALDDDFVDFWINASNFPANTTWRIQVQRPNGTIATDTGTNGFGNPFYRNSWWWWRFDVPDITGTWHFLLDLNGQRMVRAPIEARTARTPDFNRAPEAISVFLDPPAPTPNDVIFCNVDTDLVLDDLDYDIVQYHYVWEVDDVVVRDIITAGHADAIPHHTASVDSVVACTVTPGDGVAEGAPASAAVTVAEAPPIGPAGVGDDTCEGGVNPGQSCSTNADCPGGTCGAKSVYLSVSPSSGLARSGVPSSIQLTVVDIDDALGLDSVEGDVWWAGASQSISNPPNVSLNGAQVLCEAAPSNAEVWPVGTVHLFGEPIVPGSSYEVRMCDAAGANCSAPLQVDSGKWGDVVAAFGGGAQPNFADVTALVDKFKEQPNGRDTPRTDLVPQVPNQVTNFADIDAAVGAFKELAYPYSISACP